MQQQKTIIIRSLNDTPEEEVNRRLEELGTGWEIVSASTAITTHGTTEVDPLNMLGIARHIYMVTTVVVKKIE